MEMSLGRGGGQGRAGLGEKPHQVHLALELSPGPARHPPSHSAWSGGLSPQVVAEESPHPDSEAGRRARPVVLMSPTNPAVNPWERAGEVGSGSCV